MSSRRVDFYSEGVRLSGDLFLPAALGGGEKRGGIVLSHGYTGVRNLYLPDIADVLTEAGYVVLTFDYKGWGDSDGPKSRLSPYGRVLDSQAALTFLGAQPMVDADRLGLYGTSYGGATVVWTAAVDPRVKCVVAVVGIGHGRRWMRSVRRPDEFADLIERANADRVRQVMTGQSEIVDRSEILLPLTASRRNWRRRRARAILVRWARSRWNTCTKHWSFTPSGWSTRSPRWPVLFITSDNDRLVPPDESEALYAKAGEPKKLVVLKNRGHYGVYTGDAFRQVMAPTLAWFREHLPAR